MKMKRFLLVLAACLLTAGPPLSVLAQSKPETPVIPQTQQESREKTLAVLICGTGVSPHYEQMVDELLESLVERKVTVKNTEGHAFARSTCLEKTKEAGAASLLYVVANVSERFAYETTLSIQCLSADGKKLWEENEKGPLMSRSVSSTIKGITGKMKKKLQAHVGQPGLPASE